MSTDATTTELPASVKSYALYLMVMAGLGGLLYGIDVGVIAAALPYIEETSTYTPQEISLVVAAVLPLVTLFLFKKRQLQIRLCGAEVVMLLGALAFIALYYWLSVDKAFEGVEIAHKQFCWAAPMPIGSIILTYLAGRAIFKDEILVRSLDRIR